MENQDREPKGRFEIKNYRAVTEVKKMEMFKKKLKRKAEKEKMEAEAKAKKKAKEKVC